MSARIINFFDGAQSETVPVIGNIKASDLVTFADDSAYESANPGSPTKGNIYFNTTTNSIRYYDGTQWTSFDAVDFQDQIDDLDSRLDVIEPIVDDLVIDVGNLQGDLTDLGSDLSDHVADTEAHGATGAVVGTTNTQTLSNKTLTSPIHNVTDYTHISTPSNPTASHSKIYVKSDGKPYILDSAGSEVAIATGAPLTNPMTTTGDIIRAGSGGTPTRVAIGSNGDRLEVVSGVPAWVTPVEPKYTLYLTNGTFTHNITAGCKWVEFLVQGGGAGGGGNGTVASSNAGAGGAGGASKVQTSPGAVDIVVANGGNGTAGLVPAGAASPSVVSPGVDIGSCYGNPGNPGATYTSGSSPLVGSGANGGTSPRYGGAGIAGVAGTVSGGNAVVNSGSGGGSAQAGGTGLYCAASGGSGAFAHAKISSPSAAYIIIVGVGGTGGSQGAGGSGTGGAGGRGRVTVIEHF